MGVVQEATLEEVVRVAHGWIGRRARDVAYGDDGPARAIVGTLLSSPKIDPPDRFMPIIDVLLISNGQFNEQNVLDPADVFAGYEQPVVVAPDLEFREVDSNLGGAVLDACEPRRRGTRQYRLAYGLFRSDPPQSNAPEWDADQVLRTALA